MVSASLVSPADVLKENDAKLVKRFKLPSDMQGGQSLEAWGYRLGVLKGSYGKDAGKDEDIWAEWSPEMADYNEQDVEVTEQLWKWLLQAPEFQPVEIEAVQLEHEVAEIISRQERRGIHFDADGARALHVKLAAEREAEEHKVRDVFPPWYEADGHERTWGAEQKVWVQSEHGALQVWRKPKGQPKELQRGYYLWREEGAPFTPVRLTEFKPSSRAHVTFWFKRKYGWEPDEFTDKGQPKVDDAVLKKLPYPEAQKLARLFAVNKIIGYLATGKEAWLKHYNEDTQAIHGRVNSNAANTGRMTHAKPNLAQVPSGKALYGHECRALFIARPGFKLVGCDADGLEMRTMGHFLAKIDGGTFIDILLKGDKAKGTDQHSMNARALGLDPKKKYLIGVLVVTEQGKETEHLVAITGRDIAKTYFYAYVYGAGLEKLGVTLGIKGNKKVCPRRKKPVDFAAEAAGKKSLENLKKNSPTLPTLIENVQKVWQERGFIRGLDGRRLRPRKKSAVFNTLNQSAGAVVMKRALVIMDNRFQSHGLRPGVDYEFVANVHDEVQIEVLPEHAEYVATTAKEAIRDAGAFYKLRCPLDGAYEIGQSWADTH